MKIIITSLFVLVSVSCTFETKATKGYELYFSENSYLVFKQALNAIQQNKFQMADSLLRIVIKDPENRISKAMPYDINPYYYLGHCMVELGDYNQALLDLDQVVSDTTTNTDILVLKSEAYKMTGNYRQAIIICNSLLGLNIDSATILGQRAICYSLNGQKDSACKDIYLVRQLDKRDLSYLDQFSKDCN